MLPLKLSGSLTKKKLCSSNEEHSTPQKISVIHEEAKNINMAGVAQVTTTASNNVTVNTVNMSKINVNMKSHGGQLFTYDFTPTASSSTILVMTSTISISEESNSANIPWLALWNGSSFVAATSGHGLDSRYLNNAVKAKEFKNINRNKKALCQRFNEYRQGKIE